MNPGDDDPLDDRLEQRLRATLRAREPGAPSESLRLRIGRMPKDEPVGSRLAIVISRVRSTGAVGLAAAVLVTLAALLVLGRGVAPAPTGLGGPATPSPIGVAVPPADTVFIEDAAGLFTAAAVQAANARLEREYERTGTEVTVMTWAPTPTDPQVITDAERALWKNRDGNRDLDLLVVIIDPDSGHGAALETGGPLMTQRASELAWYDPLQYQFTPGSATPDDARTRLLSSDQETRDTGLWALATGVELLGPNVASARVYGGSSWLLLAWYGLTIAVPLVVAWLVVRLARRLRPGWRLRTAVLAGLALVVIVVPMSYPLTADSLLSVGLFARMDPPATTAATAPPRTPGDNKSGITFAYEPSALITLVIPLKNTGYFPVTVEGLGSNPRLASVFNLTGIGRVTDDWKALELPFSPVVIEPGQTRAIAVLYRDATCEAMGLPGTPGPGAELRNSAGWISYDSVVLRESILGAYRDVTLPYGGNLWVQLGETCPA